jgi:hypothetical protein
VREGGGEMIREGGEANVNIMNCHFKSESKASFKTKWIVLLNKEHHTIFCHLKNNPIYHHR